MTMTELPLLGLNPALADPGLDGPGRETGRRDLVSFADDRPYEGLLDAEAVHHYLRSYDTYLRDVRGLTDDDVRRTLLGYGHPKGIIQEIVARQLGADEDIAVDPESVVMTVGSQEALFLVLHALRTDRSTTVLSAEPLRGPLAGAAGLAGVRVLPIASATDLAGLADRVERAWDDGDDPRAVHVRPDLRDLARGRMDLESRHRLLELAEDLGLLILEDTTGGLGRGPRLPALKALDTGRRVVHVGSYAQAGLPGAGVGYVIADQLVTLADTATGLFADQLARIKSRLTESTSPIGQALVAGWLLENGCSLLRATFPLLAVEQRNLRHLLAALERCFGGGEVTWTVPDGGPVVVLRLPFEAGPQLLDTAISAYGVAWRPIGRTTGSPAAEPGAVGLHCGALTPTRITAGVERLAALVDDRLGRDRPVTALRRAAHATAGPAAPDRLAALLDGGLIAQTLSAAAELGIADALAGGSAGLAELARRCDAHPPSLHRLLRVLEHAEIVEEGTPGSWRLTELGAGLRTDVLDSLRQRALLWNLREMREALAALAYSVRTGRPAFPRLAGADWWSYAAAGHDVEGAEHSGRGVVEAVADACDLNGVRRLVDVGCGDGLLTAELLGGNPALTATLLDLPSVVGATAEVLATAGVADRATLVAGDFFLKVPGGGDVYLLSRVLHYWDDEQAAEILRTVKGEMEQAGRILIVENIAHHCADGPDRPAGDVVMLAVHGGRSRTIAEFAALLSEAGLRLTETLPAHPEATVLVAER